MRQTSLGARDQPSSVFLTPPCVSPELLPLREPSEGALWGRPGAEKTGPGRGLGGQSRRGDQVDRAGAAVEPQGRAVDDPGRNTWIRFGPRSAPQPQPLPQGVREPEPGRERCSALPQSPCDQGADGVRGEGPESRVSFRASQGQRLAAGTPLRVFTRRQPCGVGAVLRPSQPETRGLSLSPGRQTTSLPGLPLSSAKGGLSPKVVVSRTKSG